MTDYFRVAACAPIVSPGDVEQNAKNIQALAQKVWDEHKPELITFPELSMTGYTCGDLFLNETLLQAVEQALPTLNVPCPIIVGAPIVRDGRILNAAVVVHKGEIAAVIAKTYLPTYSEFYELRWFQPSTEIPPLVEVNGVKIGVEICEDVWVPIPPSSQMAIDGAEILVNLSASDDNVGKYDYLHSLLSQQSARCIAAYVYASAGWGESTTDVVFDPKTIIYENGHQLACNKRWQMKEHYVIADIDVAALRYDRCRKGSFNQHPTTAGRKTVKLECPKPKYDCKLLRTISPMPFVPMGEELNARCDEVFNIQTLGLARRLQATNTKNIVLGISGGLDSTLALLVAVNCFDRLGLDRKGIHGITMPGFGTTDRTRGNAHVLMEKLGITMREIPIGPAVEQHFRDIDHDPNIKDVTYENAQARMRTFILMDIANQVKGMVLGTGDMSELALGWATYNGDHMSMYGVNASVPKTLVRDLVKWVSTIYPDLKETLDDIVATPVSPELLPGQVTEDTVGAYELHDFYLYYTLRYGASPQRIFRLARQAFNGKYDDRTILKWMREFFRRFFQQQFKRSCLPDGPKTGMICLSPRGDWRMPSDASPDMWLTQIDQMIANLP